jgi:glycosyltransferase involved in cell wall biosynthesis
MVAPLVPDRTGNGLAMRLGIFLEALAEVAEVDLVVPSLTPARLPPSLGIMTGVFPMGQPVDTHFDMILRLRDVQRRLAAFRAYGRPSYAACVTPEVLDYLRALGRQRAYDLVHVGRIYMAEAGLAAAGAGSRLSLDLDEDEYASLTSIAEMTVQSGDGDRAEWHRIDAAALDRMVARLGARFERVWVSNDDDRGTLAARHPAMAPLVVANAVEVPPAPQRRDNGSTLLFVGTFGYEPNIEGIMWYGREVWPRLRARMACPVRTLVAGAHPPASVRRLDRRRGLFGRWRGNPDFEILGYVTDLKPLYEGATLAIAPLRAGRGTRLKLLEAAAQGVPIVTTTAAAHGLPLEPPWLWRGDDADAFAQACADALANADERARRAERGRALVAAHYDRAKVVAALAGQFSDMLSGAPRHRTRAAPVQA